MEPVGTPETGARRASWRFRQDHGQKARHRDADMQTRRHTLADGDAQEDTNTHIHRDRDTQHM